MKNDKYLPLLTKSKVLKFFKNGNIKRKIGTEWVTVGSKNRSGYLSFTFKGHKFYNHRAIFFIFNKKIDTSKVINHKNGKKDDNRIQNLNNISYSHNAFWFSQKKYLPNKRKSNHQKVSLELLSKLVSDPNYKIQKNGIIKTNVPKKGSGLLPKKRTIKFSKQQGYYVMRYKRSTFLVHRVIFFKFNKFLTSGYVINHKDNNPLNNNLLNLECVSYKQNRIHSLKFLKSKISKKQIKLIRIKYIKSKVFSFKQEAINLNISISYLRSLINNSKKTDSLYLYKRKINPTSNYLVKKARVLFLTKKYSQKEIANLLGLNYSTIKDIIRNRSFFSKKYSKQLLKF